MVDFGLPRDSLADEGMVAQPTPSPLLIDPFYLHSGTSPETAEDSIQMVWKDPEVGGVTRVYRRISPLVAQSLPSGFQALVVPTDEQLSPFGWTVVAVRGDEHPGTYHSFVDEDIPAIDESAPKAARRTLGAAYAYKIEVTGSERIARSPVLSTRRRGINSPRLESATVISDSEIRVTWRDNSRLASGFQVRHFEQPDGANERVITLNGTMKQEMTLHNLMPDTDHVVTVRAWDFYGSSSESNSGMAHTDPAPDAEPEDKTFDVRLYRQQVYEGNIPYLGRFPTAGVLPAGTLRKVSLLSVWPALFFVKPNNSTDNCTDPNATVRLAPGASLTAAEMMELFGGETPDLPIVFLACAQATSTLYDWIPIRITYRTT